MIRITGRQTLRLHRQWPYGHAAQQGDEFPPLHCASRQLRLQPIIGGQRLRRKGGLHAAA
jgi:hypothetical protein